MLIVALLILALLASLLYAGTSLAPWLPTKRPDWEIINRLAALKPGQVFLEMGCGSGALAVYIARHNPQAQVVGVELAWPIYALAKLRQWFSGCEHLNIVFGNVLKYDIRDADVLYVFGRPETLGAKLKDKLLREMKPSARLISYIFAIEGWPKQATAHQGKSAGYPIYVYQK